MKVFSKEKYIDRMHQFIEEETDEDIKEAVEKVLEWSCKTEHWASVLDGEEVINGRIAEFYIVDEWCIDTEGEDNE